MLPTISTVIIEDEPSAVKRLTKELKRLGDIQFDIVTSIDSVAGAIDWFDGSKKVDLVFMDIQLSDGLSFEIFKNTSISSPVIFTTAYDEYALQAFKVNSLDYLLKPINPPDLRNAIDRFLALHDNFSREAYMDQLVRLANEFRPQTYRSSFLVAFKQKMVLVNVEDVAYIYVKERGVFLKKKDETEHVIDFFLDQLEKQLDPSLFYRANRQYLVARSAIVEIEPYFTGRLLLIVKPGPPSPVIISKEKASHFKRWADY